MKEDLIERLTSLVFSDELFSSTVLKLCREVTRENEQKYLQRLMEIEDLKPVHVGISEYLRLDSTGNILEVFDKLRGLNEIPEEMS